jgi:hypothetical protein
VTAGKPRHLTEEEARSLTRREILDRVEAEQAWLLSRRAMTQPQRAQYGEIMKIMHAAIDPVDAIDTVQHTLDGRPDGYWEARPLSPHQLTLGLDPQYYTTGTCACGWTAPRSFLEQPVREAFAGHVAAEADPGRLGADARSADAGED